jgi:hypothetical protein
MLTHQIFGGPYLFFLFLALYLPSVAMLGSKRRKPSQNLLRWSSKASRDGIIYLLLTFDSHYPLGSPGVTY